MNKKIKKISSLVGIAAIGVSVPLTISSCSSTISNNETLTSNLNNNALITNETNPTVEFTIENYSTDKTYGFLLTEKENGIFDDTKATITQKAEKVTITFINLETGNYLFDFGLIIDEKQAEINNIFDVVVVDSSSIHFINWVYVKDFKDNITGESAPHIISEYDAGNDTTLIARAAATMDTTGKLLISNPEIFIDDNESATIAFNNIYSIQEGAKIQHKVEMIDCSYNQQIDTIIATNDAHVAEHAFMNTSISNVILTSEIKNVGSHAFSNASIESFIIKSDSIHLYEYCLSNNTLLATIILPKFTYIHYNVFFGTPITNITCSQELHDYLTSSDDGNNNGKSDGKEYLQFIGLLSVPTITVK